MWYENCNFGVGNNQSFPPARERNKTVFSYGRFITRRMGSPIRKGR